jgi:hypothetical protein
MPPSQDQPAQNQPTENQPVQGQPTATAIPWEQYVGHIVRWEDNTTWFVLRDGRHWIPDGQTYQKLINAKAQVFNLQAPQLDAIPDIKGSHISVTGA